MQHQVQLQSSNCPQSRQHHQTQQQNKQTNHQQSNTTTTSTIASAQHQSIISSVERPSPNSPTPYQTRLSTSPIPRINKQPPPTSNSNSNSVDTSTPLSNSPSNNNNNNHETAATNAVIISQLQQLQSPLPKLTEGELPITQVTSNKSRQRGFFSQLLCCFRPTSSNVYQDSNRDIYNYVNASQHNNSLTPKYSGKYLLPARKPSDNRICLVIDLDETLVHSSFKPIQDADFTVPVEIDGTIHQVFVLKRPHVDEFLKKVGQLYECVLFTASLAKYADPVADLLDPEHIFKARLFRESCAFYRGNYVKDLSRLGRDLNRVIIVDNSPVSYIFHPDNALPVKSYFDDDKDNELLNLIPLLERIATSTGAVVPINMCYNN